jgi:hypothetical protein
MPVLVNTVNYLVKEGHRRTGAHHVLLWQDKICEPQHFLQVRYRYVDAVADHISEM